jgi:hypothetical protein
MGVSAGGAKNRPSHNRTDYQHVPQDKAYAVIGEILCASDPKLVKKWRETCAAIKGANSGRTKIVHAQWGFRGHDTAICVMTFEEGESKPNVELMPIKKLARYSDGIAVAQRALASFLASVKVEATTTGTHRWPPQHRAKMVRA